MNERTIEETYHRVLRSKIPWGLKISYEKCVSCGKCAEHCHMGVYEFEEKIGEKILNEL